tara:strand:+ start:6423 stop:6761 length:339 start_codon:yes stop_codon:yes gene_type:complete
METFDLLNNYLPLELINKILYEHKGLTHPTATIIIDHWNDMDAQYNIYLNVEHIITRKRMRLNDDSFTIVTEETYNEIWQEYPRLYFFVDYDFIETIIYEQYDSDEEIELLN